MSDWIVAATVDELKPGEVRVVDADGTAIAVFNVAGAFFALEDVCTHDGGQLTGGCIEGGEVVCPRHGARFSICSGEALTPPAYEATAVFPVRVEAGQVLVRDDRWD
jgi:3-phenylpropionate/trans-cinnamate dioxygenase ferredoxin component